MNVNEVKAYVCEKREELDEYFDESEIRELCEDVKNKFNVQCDYEMAGEFDSPGYSVQGYVVMFVDTDGVLGGVSFESISC